MSAKAYETLSKSNELTPVSEAAQSPEQRNDDEKERKKRIRGVYAYTHTVSGHGGVLRKPADCSKSQIDDAAENG